MAQITFDKLQHIYDLHARDFGLMATKDLEQLQKLDEALRAHLVDEETSVTTGFYRGKQAYPYFHSTTHNVEVIDRFDQVIAAFKASPAQASYIISVGRLT